ncbi:hypothetical protein HXX01_02915, partial [Candidatus Nomurabacteria bacterium]|nr:hypothetical protein [Candidatus Nomurabacteria bacterium]
MKLLRIISSVTIVMSMLILQSCGGGVSSGETTSGSLALVIDRTTVNSGDQIVATVTLSSSIAGRALNGIGVRVMSSDQNAMSDKTGTTNTSGVATIVIPAKWLSADKDVTLVAGADGVSQSVSQKLTIIAPKLVVNVPATNANSFKAGGGFGQIIMGGTSLSFKNGTGNPIVGQSVDFDIVSITNKLDFEEVIFNPVQGSQIASPPGFLTTVTDSNGIAQIPFKLTVAIPSVAGALNVLTLNWRAVTQYQGVTFITTG